VGLSYRIMKDLPGGSDNKRVKLKQGNICVRVKGNPMAMVRNDKQDAHILMNMHKPPAEGIL